MHYAQLLSYPSLQLKFLHELEELRIRVRQHGGVASLICGETPSDRTAELSDVLRERALIDTIMIGDPGRADVTDIRGDAGGAGVGRASIFSPDGREMPGFAGVLRFGDSQVVVPFTGLNLMESAAHITQLMLEGKPLPRMTEKGRANDYRYIGCWEVWRRMHTGRYGSETDLALAFLAAVDLVLGAHVLAQEDDAMKSALKQPDYSVSIKYMHARFGYLALWAAAVDPLDSSNGALGAIRKFQYDCSAYIGWPDPRRAYRFMAAFLTRRLLEASLWAFEQNVEIDEDGLRTAILAPLDEIADDLNLLVPAWGMLQASFHSTLTVGSPNFVQGSRVLAKMISSSVFRGEDRPALAAPHLAPETLAGTFQLPCVRIGNQYYMDTEIESPEQQPVIQVPAVDISADCIHLAALESIRKDQNKCGLIDQVTKAANCVYVAGGAGCPQLGLSKVERERRAAEGVHDWCHWSYVSLLTRLAPDSQRLEWEQRWRQERGHHTDGAG